MSVKGMRVISRADVWRKGTIIGRELIGNTPVYTVKWDNRDITREYSITIKPAV